MNGQLSKIFLRVLLIGWFSASAFANVLQNGGFATSPSCQAASLSGSGLSQTDVPYDTTLPCDWLLDGPASIVSNVNAIQQSSSELPSGLVSPPLYTGNYVAFAGGGGVDCLDQFVSTTQGDDYIVSFYAAVVGPSPGFNASLTFEWVASGNCTQTSSVLPCPLGETGDETVSQFGGNGIYETDTLCAGIPCFNYYSYTFTASTTGMTQVFFHGGDLDEGDAQPGNGGNFVLVADADIEQVSPSTPEPTSLLLIISGLAILGRCGSGNKTRKNGFQQSTGAPRERL